MTIVKLNEPQVLSRNAVLMWSLWSPSGAWFLAYVILICIRHKRPDWIKWLALKSAAEKFEEVLLSIENKSTAAAVATTTTVGDGSSERPKEPSYVPRLRVQGDLIHETHQDTFYGVYVVLCLPMQIAFIIMLILRQLFIEQLSSETCSHYLNYYSLKTDYYDCCLKNRIKQTVTNESYYDTNNVISYCLFRNQTGNADAEDVFCKAYLLDITGLIDVVASIYAWHKLLSLISILIIRFNYLMTTKIRNIHAYYSVTTLLPGLLLYVALIVYIVVSSWESFSIMNFIPGAVGLGLLLIFFFNIARITYRFANRKTDQKARHLPNFSETYVVVRNQQTETTRLHAQIN